MRDRLCSRVASPSGREQAAPLRPIDLPAVREEEDPHPVEGGIPRQVVGFGRPKLLWFEAGGAITIGVEVAIEDERRNEL